MPKRWRLKPNKNLRENARLVLPLMFDEFLSHRGRVLGHPRLKIQLHRMRLAGKTLRYAMEVFEDAFGPAFGSCLEEVKELLDTMGSVHDCDVNVPRLQDSLREVRLFNRSRADAQDRISTGAAIRLIREQMELRKSLFEKMSVTIEQWAHKNFKEKVLRSLSATT